ncbi:hypothetical protein L1987_84482 [Smallanthus sonchifolius]|uniref:Uncharacterized protein n=1 Tax=Smallanthus sonchifolius TaxID=185202 RepID=A0ACB8YG17_9ASTR|nr:hypothetical protein L1987_84482 [Smallanthus sonchifolius]
MFASCPLNDYDTSSKHEGPAPSHEDSIEPSLKSLPLGPPTPAKQDLSHESSIKDDEPTGVNPEERVNKKRASNSHEVLVPKKQKGEGEQSEHSSNSNLTSYDTETHIEQRIIAKVDSMEQRILARLDFHIEALRTDMTNRMEEQTKQMLESLRKRKKKGLFGKLGK